MKDSQNRLLSTAGIAVTALMLAAGPSHAQNLWDAFKDRVVDNVADSVERTVVDTIPGSPENAGAAGGVRAKSIVNHRSDFVPGRQVIFQDSFAAATAGSMPRTWKTNGSGSVVTLDGIPGKWLALQTKSQYKLKTSPRYPTNFTVEFDVVAATDQVKDLSLFKFGFDADNSVGSGSASSLSDVVLSYGHGHGGWIDGNATDYQRHHDYSLSGFANRVMHVAITVEGENMKVYLDGTKIEDARLFLGDPAKHFFLDAPDNARHGAALLVGNFRIAALD